MDVRHVAIIRVVVAYNLWWESITNFQIKKCVRCAGKKDEIINSKWAKPFGPFPFNSLQLFM